MWKILIVDDDYANRLLLLEILKDEAECEVAVNGKEAIDQYEAALPDKPFDLILLDIAMPEVDGIKCLKTIRDKEKEKGIEAEKRIPIIMVTAYKETLVKAFNQGCDDYILKPIDGNALIEKMKEKLGDSKA